MKISIILICSLFCAAAIAQTVWTPIASGTQNKLNCVSFGTDQVGYIGGEDSTLLKTVDGGKTWQRIALNITENIGWKFVTDLQFLDANNGYALVNNAIFSTTDGAATWTSEQPNSTNMCFKDALYFFDAQNGFVGGAMCFQGATVGNKINGAWDTVEFIGTGWGDERITAFDFLNPQVGIAVSTGKYFYRTTNSGATWDTISHPLDSIAMSDVKFINDTLVYATYQTVGLEGALVSFDAGLTWERDLDLATFAYPGFDAMTKTNYNRPFLGGQASWGNQGIIFEKTPLYWMYSIVPQHIHGLASHSDSTVFAVGDSGYIAVNVLPQNIGIATESIQAFYAYPNPAATQIVVQANADFTAKIIQVYNANGQLVYRHKMENEKTNIDCSAWPAGVYLLQVGEKVQRIVITK